MINRDRARVGSASFIAFGFVVFTAGFLACFVLDGLHSAKPKRGPEPMQHSAGSPPVLSGPGIVADATQPITIDGFPLMPEPDMRSLAAADVPAAGAHPAGDAAEVAALKEDVLVLKNEIGEMERLLNRCGDSPYAQAWRLGELDSATKEEQEAVRVILEYAPVSPMPGDVLWLLERVRLMDWSSWGCMESALVWRFGEQRVRDAVGNQRFEELFTDE